MHVFTEKRGKHAHLNRKIEQKGRKMSCKIDGCNNGKVIAFGLCSKHYTRLRRYNDVNFVSENKGGLKPKPINFSIDSYGCFVITSHVLNADGYSEIMIKGTTKKIHRHIYEECFGEIPKGLIIRHKCDNPSCINPEHLEVGTHQDNIKDMMLRGRQAKGTKKPLSKLNENDVLIIKKSLLNGETNRNLAKKFKVDESIISNIKNNKMWKHVSLEESK